MKTCRKNIYVIKNKGTEDCYTATCNHAVLHIQCIEHQSYNKIYQKQQKKTNKKNNNCFNFFLICVN